MPWILRLLLYIAAPVTALFVARDALNFGFVQMMVAAVLLTGLVAIFSFWPRSRKL
jgi:hypothetical protein